jgi:outer membrane protein OmpA-like peptidoglycan-associated protein
LLRERNSTLEDSLGNNAVTGKSKINVLTATRTDQVSPPSTDTPEYKAYAGKASKQQPTTSGNDEVARLRSELAGLQKEKESLMRQLDNTATTPVSVPDNPGRASGNDNAATQEDINSLKSEIQSLKGAIKENSNNQVVAPKRSFFPAIVPSIGVGVGKTKVEQVVQHDTIFVERPSDTASHVDTVRVTDTVRIRDTVRVSDTVKQIVRDTVQQAVVKDTVITVINTAAKQKESLLALPPFIILFDIGKSDVKLVYRKRLDYYASQLIQHQDLKVVITGHTDKTGSVANNLILSEKRAKSISGYLVGKGVSSDAMQLDKLGEAAPIAENNTKEGQSQNRRVELIFREK